MSVAAQTQISYRPIDSVGWLIDQVNDRIRHKAFDYFIERGATDGYDLDDWFRAESTVLQKPDTRVRRTDHGFAVEIDLPEIHPEDIMLFVGPMEVVVGTNPHDDGRQVFRVIQFPESIETHNVDAEFADSKLKITAIILNNGSNEANSAN